MIVAIIQAYLVMIQRYNYIRIEEVIEKGKPLEEKKIKNLKIYILKKDKQLKMHRVCLYHYNLWKQETLSESLEDILDHSSYLELMYYKQLFCRLEEQNRQGIWYSNEYDVPSLDGCSSDKILFLNYDTSKNYNVKK